MRGFRFVDLFAGVGGFHHALSALGGRCVFACELDGDARAVYQASFPGLPARRFPADIRSITQEGGRPRTATEIAARVPDHDVLCGGFPCQPFSKGGAQMGTRDRARGTLFYDILQIICAKSPRYLILENVRNLAGPRHRDTWSVIIRSLREAGYSVSADPLVLSPHRIPPERGGAPQIRDRIFILGVRSDLAVPRAALDAQSLESQTCFPSWDPDTWRIADYLDPDRAIDGVEGLRLSPQSMTWIRAWDHFVRELPDDELPGFPIWAYALRDRAYVPGGTPEWKASHLRKNAAFYRKHRAFIDDWLTRRWGPKRQTVRDFPPSRTSLEWQARKAHPIQRGRTLSDLVLQFRQSGLRAKPPSYLPALVAIAQTSIVGPGVAEGIETYRTLSPREAARLQGLPLCGFELAGVPDRAIYKQLGNAVNVGVVRLVAEVLLGIGTRGQRLLDGRSGRPSVRASVPRASSPRRRSSRSMAMS